MLVNLRALRNNKTLIGYCTNYGIMNLDVEEQDLDYTEVPVFNPNTERFEIKTAYKFGKKLYITYKVFKEIS